MIARHEAGPGGPRVDVPAPVAETELLATVQRMEARWTTAPPAALVPLVDSYKALVGRFEIDLAASARDVLLARASALMLIQQYAARTESDAGTP